MIHFDVLTEPWISVIDLQGNKRELGVLELLEQAPRLKEIADPVITYEYGIFRFLCTFLMDAYRPREWSDLEELYQSGKFDMRLIRDYVAVCKEEGASFDLFDKERPFLQAGFDEKYDKKLVSVAALNIALPSGNNHVHFDHRLEEEQVMTCAEAAKGLCAINLFCTAGVRGYPSTVNGAPPIYFILDDKTLFGSLVYSMIAEDEAGNISYSDPPPVWRCKAEIVPQEKETDTSVLYGMMYPCRRILLKPEEDGNIVKMFLSQGKNYVAYDAWRDPHVSYLLGEKGRVSLKSSMEKEPWRNIISIMAQKDTALTFVRRIVEENLLDDIALKAYCVTTSQANYLDMQKSRLRMPRSIAESEIKSARIQELIQEIEKMSRILGRSLNECYEYSKKAIRNMIQSVQADFFDQCRDYLLRDIFAEMAGIPDKEASRCKEAHVRTLRKSCLKTFDHAVGAMMSTGSELVRIQKKRKALLEMLYAENRKE